MTTVDILERLRRMGAALPPINSDEDRKTISDAIAVIEGYRTNVTDLEEKLRLAERYYELENGGI